MGCRGVNRHCIGVARGMHVVSIVALKHDSLYCGPQLDISYDTFIRTTDEVHARVVGEMMSRVWDRDVYRSEYRGWYCVGCEEYKDELELEPGREGSGVRSGMGLGKKSHSCPIITCHPLTAASIGRARLPHPQETVRAARRGQLFFRALKVSSSAGGGVGGECGWVGSGSELCCARLAD